MKTVLITGYTDGIGKGAARTLITAGHRVLLHGRSAEKLEATKEELGGAVPGASLGAYRADLSNPAEVIAMANVIASEEAKVDAIVNNAGILKTPNSRTSSGHDVRFMVNTFAPVLLTRMLMAQVPADGRIVNLSSAAQRPVSAALLTGAKAADDDFDAYAQSKLALTMWSRRMADRNSKGPSFYAVNPGSLLATNMVVEGFGMKRNDPGKGEGIIAEAAVDPSFEGHSGQYFDNDAGSARGDWGAPHPDALSDAKCDAVIALIEGELKKLRGA